MVKFEALMKIIHGCTKVCKFNFRIIHIYHSMGGLLEKIYAQFAIYFFSLANILLFCGYMVYYCVAVSIPDFISFSPAFGRTEKHNILNW